MAAFSELDWSRIDVFAIVADRGIATIDEQRRNKCVSWLKRNGYEVESVDCSRGLTHAIPELGRILGWQRQFGYALEAGHRNLDVLRDGFEFNVPVVGGKVLELYRADVEWREDAGWLLGLLGIADEASRRELALGKRFFTLLALPQNSPLVGQAVETTTVPVPYWNPCEATHKFNG